MATQARGRTVVRDARELRVKESDRLAAMGETLAREEKRRMERKWGPAGGGTPPVPLPVVVPLADESPDLRSFPVATVFLIGLAAALYLLGQVRGARLPLPDGLPALPAGAGFAGVPKLWVGKQEVALERGLGASDGSGLHARLQPVQAGQRLRLSTRFTFALAKG